jgi:hypothetical protein
MEKKIFSLLIAFLLTVITLLAASVFAQEKQETTLQATSVSDLQAPSISEVVEVSDISEAKEAVPELEEAGESLPEFYWLVTATIADGFVLKADETDARLFRGVWIVSRGIEKAIEKAEENLTIEKKEFGVIEIGFGAEKEKFRIRFVSKTDDSIKFNVNKLGEEILVGSLTLKPKNYSSITIWYGELNLNEGSYQGTWKLTAVSKTKIIKPVMRKPAAWNIFAIRERREAKLRERIEEKVLEIEKLKNQIESLKAEQVAIAGKAEPIPIAGKEGPKPIAEPTKPKFAQTAKKRK